MPMPTRPRPAKPVQFDPLVPQPAYGRVATAIEQKILERSLRPGDLLPTETELARQFGVIARPCAGAATAREPGAWWAGQRRSAA
jgi:hypothetical protein